MSSSGNSSATNAETPPKDGGGLGGAAPGPSTANRVTDIEWLLMPPIMLNQFHMWQDQGRPHGFASWAYFGEEQEERIATKGIRRLMPTDWKTGEALWLIDFVAPFGEQEAMVEELRLKILPGKRMKMLQARPEGGTGVVEW